MLVLMPSLTACQRPRVMFEHLVRSMQLESADAAPDAYGNVLRDATAAGSEITEATVRSIELAEAVAIVVRRERSVFRVEMAVGLLTESVRFRTFHIRRWR